MQNSFLHNHLERHRILYKSTSTKKVLLRCFRLTLLSAQVLPSTADLGNRAFETRALPEYRCNSYASTMCIREFNNATLVDHASIAPWCMPNPKQPA